MPSLFKKHGYISSLSNIHLYFELAKIKVAKIKVAKISDIKVVSKILIQT
jgi:hypothetical protein